MEKPAMKRLGTKAPIVLLVEGSKSVQAVLRRILELGGHRVLSAGCGSEALRLLTRHSVDLVIADIPMSDLDGVEILMWLRQTHPGLPILAMSADEPGNAGDPLAIARRVGVHLTLPKPFGAIELLAAVQQLLGGRRAVVPVAASRRPMADAFERWSATPPSNEETTSFHFSL